MLGDSWTEEAWKELCNEKAWVMALAGELTSEVQEAGWLYGYHQTVL